MARKARQPLIRFLVFLGLVVGGILVLRATPLNRYLQPDDLTALLEELRQQPAAPILFVIGGALLPAFGLPASVIIFVGGAVFGTLRGALLSFVGLYGCALLGYLLARTLARDLVVQLLGKRLAFVEGLLERHGFWTMVRLRLLPIPYGLVNFSAGLVGVRARTFILSTLLGLPPGVFVFSYFSSAMVTAAEGDRAEAFRNVGIASVLAFSLTFLPAILKAWRRRVRRDPGQGPPQPRADR